MDLIQIFNIQAQGNNLYSHVKNLKIYRCFRDLWTPTFLSPLFWDTLYYFTVVMINGTMCVLHATFCLILFWWCSSEMNVLTLACFKYDYVIKVDTVQ